ncbi:MAG: DUF4843 domain-containing protein [Marinifilaceae bacterium]|nr:DUF4843 domain-containing protein [Marinifilaceae bacterium]
MKSILKYMAAILLLTTYSCDEEYTKFTDNFVGFNKSSESVNFEYYNTETKTAKISLELVGGDISKERTISIAVNSDKEATTAANDQYKLLSNSVVLPKGSYVAEFDVEVYGSEFTLGEEKELELNLSSSDIKIMGDQSALSLTLSRDTFPTVELSKLASYAFDYEAPKTEQKDTVVLSLSAKADKDVVLTLAATDIKGGLVAGTDFVIPASATVAKGKTSVKVPIVYKHNAALDYNLANSFQLEVTNQVGIDGYTFKKNPVSTLTFGNGYKFLEKEWNDVYDLKQEDGTPISDVSILAIEGSGKLILSNFENFPMNIQMTMDNSKPLEVSFGIETQRLTETYGDVVFQEEVVDEETGKPKKVDVTRNIVVEYQEIKNVSGSIIEKAGVMQIVMNYEISKRVYNKEKDAYLEVEADRITREKVQLVKK